MTFLNTLFLFAIPLIVVPLVLHFVRRRERRVVHWGAMRFLQEATTESSRMRLPESLLLLLARCLLITGLALALAQPLINWGQGSAVSDRELIVIVDDSLSTARRSDGDPVFAQIQKSAKEVVSSSSQALPFQLMFTSGGGIWVGDQPQTAESAAGKTALIELAKRRPGLGQADLMTCIRKAMSAANERETSTRPRPTQRIVVVTDGTTPAWSDSDQVALERLRSTIEESNLSVKIQVLEVEGLAGSFENLSVVELTSDVERVGVKESCRFSAEVQNTGSAMSAPCRLAWRVGDKVLGHSEIEELEAGASTQAFWSTRFKTAGPVTVIGELEQTQPDDLPEDSVSIKVVDVVEQIPILLVENQSFSSGAQLQQTTFFTSALGYDGEEADSQYHSIFAPTIVSTDEIFSEDLSIYSAIVVLGTDNDSPELAELLLPEVQRGCGLWVFVSPDPDVEAFNLNWYLAGEGLSPLALVEPDSTNKDSDVAEVRVHPPSAQHPATKVLSDQQRLDLDQVVIKHHATFQTLLLGDEVSVPIRSNRGEPLVVENSLGQGRVLVQSFPISMQATNLQVTNSFVIMVHEWLEYLGKPSATNLNLSVGSPLVWRFEDRNQRPATLELPDGGKIDLTEDPQAYGVADAAGTFRFFSTQMPGLYRARNSTRSDSPMEMPFYIAPAVDELKAKPISPELRTRLGSLGKFDLAATAGDLDAKAQEFWGKQEGTSSKTAGNPIWHWIVLGLVGMLMLELVLAGRVGRQRGGVHVSATQQLQTIEQLIGPSAAAATASPKKSKKETTSVS